MVIVEERQTCVETEAGGNQPPTTPAPLVTPDQGEFRFHRAKSARLIEHSEGVAIIDATGAVTVVDVALIRSAYALVMRDRMPVVDARVVQG